MQPIFLNLSDVCHSYSVLQISSSYVLQKYQKLLYEICFLVLHFVVNLFGDHNIKLYDNIIL